MSGVLRVLAVAPYCDGEDVGEAWCAHQWVSHLARHAQVTLLTVKRAGRRPASAQLSGVEVVEWDERLTTRRYDRLASMLKPGYLDFYARAGRWIAAALREGRHFDIAHQFTPIALRYPSPLARFPIPYVIGPLGGSLDTPPGFAAECKSSAWYTRLRGLDRWRLRHDPTIRHTVAHAAAVLGVAPYVEELLAPAAPRRFEVISELGIDSLATRRFRGAAGQLKLLHVGRAVRTKGLRDAVRAMALLPEDVDVTLDVAGRGEETQICCREAMHSGVGHRVTFHGQLPRAGVEDLYARSDAFLFPSFREPSGSVVFEALRHGLPVITTDRGGPGFVIDESCGMRVPATNPNQLARDLATSITTLAREPALRERLSQGAHARVRAIGLWENKMRWLLELYGDLIANPQHLTLKEVV
jgi:glycosyltransferase involved in cell wall biosynthesis